MVRCKRVGSTGRLSASAVGVVVPYPQYRHVDETLREPGNEREPGVRERCCAGWGTSGNWSGPRQSVRVQRQHPLRTARPDRRSSPTPPESGASPSPGTADPTHRALIMMLGYQSQREVLRARFRTKEGDGVSRSVTTASTSAPPTVRLPDRRRDHIRTRGMPGGAGACSKSISTRRPPGTSGGSSPGPSPRQRRRDHRPAQPAVGTVPVGTRPGPQRPWRHPGIVTPHGGDHPGNPATPAGRSGTAPPRT